MKQHRVFYPYKLAGDARTHQGYVDVDGVARDEAVRRVLAAADAMPPAASHEQARAAIGAALEPEGEAEGEAPELAIALEQLGFKSWEEVREVFTAKARDLSDEQLQDGVQFFDAFCELVYRVVADEQQRRADERAKGEG